MAYKTLEDIRERKNIIGISFSTIRGLEDLKNETDISETAFNTFITAIESLASDAEYQSDIEAQIADLVEELPPDHAYHDDLVPIMQDK